MPSDLVQLTVFLTTLHLTPNWRSNSLTSRWATIFLSTYKMCLDSYKPTFWHLVAFALSSLCWTSFVTPWKHSLFSVHQRPHPRIPLSQKSLQGCLNQWVAQRFLLLRWLPFHRNWVATITGWDTIDFSKLSIKVLDDLSSLPFSDRCCILLLHQGEQPKVPVRFSTQSLSKKPWLYTFSGNWFNVQIWSLVLILLISFSSQLQWLNGNVSVTELITLTRSVLWVCWRHRIHKIHYNAISKKFSMKSQ